MAQKWYSNGKLMLTGEYFVLFGAKSLAIPLKYGQSLEIVEETGSPMLSFVTYVLGKPWFEAKYNNDFFEILEATDAVKACYLQELFLGARTLNPLFLRQRKKVIATANLNFHMDWGIGSSSSLISNIAWWANIDPYELNRLVSRGSGFDISCARSQTPLFYSLAGRLPVIEHIGFKPKSFSKIWFVYLGKKQATEANLASNIDKINPSSSQIAEISQISAAFTKAGSASEICSLIAKHEKIISKALHQEPIQSLLFSDFEGAVKSLGAWGGDFCLAVSDLEESYVKSYFEQKGLSTVLSYEQLSI